MITLLTGDDEISSNDFIRNTKKQFPKDNIYTFEGNFEPTEIYSLSNSNSLFGGKMLFILSPKQVTSLDLTEDFLKEASKRNDLLIIFNLLGINLNSKMGKFLKEVSGVKTFTLPKDYRFFNICDALFMEKNKVKTISLIRNTSDIEEDFYPLLATFQMSLRNFLSCQYKNKLSSSIHPFMKQKITSYKVNELEARQMYQKLFEMDLSSKTKRVDKMNLLVDFVLYSL